MGKEQARAPRGESIQDARENLVEASRDYGLFPVWAKSVDLAETFGETESDFAITRLENAVRRDLLRRIRRMILNTGVDSTPLRQILTNAAKESKAKNKPPSRSRLNY